MTQSFNIPDGISSDALQNILDDKQELKQMYSSPEERVNLLCDIAEKACDLSQQYDHLNGDDHAMIHKIMIIDLCKQFLHFHNVIGHKVAQQDFAASGAWYRDAGKFQAILNLLDTIEITNADFTIDPE